MSFDISIPPQIELGLGAQLEYKGLLLNNMWTFGVTPDDVGALDIWLKPESLGADGSSIASWTDSSGNGNHAAQGTSNRRPTVVANALNGYKAANFVNASGQEDFLTSPKTARATGTYFVVAKATGGETLLGLGNNNAKLTRGAPQWAWTATEALGSVNIGGDSTQWQVPHMKFVSTSSAVGYVNGVAGTSFDPHSQYSGYSALNIGVNDSAQASSGLTGQVVEVIVFQTALSDTDRLKVLGYLSNKYPSLGSFGTDATPQRNSDVYRILRMDGVGGLPDIRDSREINPSRHGETSLSSFYSGRPIVLDGRIEAGNLPKLRAMEYALRSAFSGLDDDWLYFRAWNTSSLDTRIKCRATGLSIAEAQENYHYRRNFQITMRAPNPFFTSVSSFSDEKIFTQTTPGTPAPVTVTNNGNFKAYPRIRITGPVTNPTIRNTVNNLQMAFTITLTAGQYIDIDVEKRTLIDHTGANRFSTLSSASQWIVLEPGVNTIDHYAFSFTGVGKTTVTAEHTWV